LNSIKRLGSGKSWVILKSLSFTPKTKAIIFMIIRHHWAVPTNVSLNQPLAPVGAAA
jgi:hypothetical protein